MLEGVLKYVADSASCAGQGLCQAGLVDFLTKVAVRGALIGGSLADRSLFWARAALGENQLRMHDCAPDGTISIGGVSEQLYGEGFVGAFHEVLAKELGTKHAAALYEIGVRCGRWEVAEAIGRGVWVPRLLRPFVGRPELMEKVRKSELYHALLRESLRILFRMVMTEGGWGVVEDVDLRSVPIRVAITNTPESRRLGRTGECSCHLMAGVFAGYFGTILGSTASARETTCVSSGDPRCTFEVTIGVPEAAQAAKPEPATAKAQRVSAEGVGASAGAAGSPHRPPKTTPTVGSADRK